MQSSMQESAHVSSSHPPQVPPPPEAALDLRPIVFHVRPDEAKQLERALKHFGCPRRRRGAALVAAVRMACCAKKGTRK